MAVVETLRHVIPEIPPTTAPGQTALETSAGTGGLPPPPWVGGGAPSPTPQQAVDAFLALLLVVLLLFLASSLATLLPRKGGPGPSEVVMQPRAHREYRREPPDYEYAGELALLRGLVDRALEELERRGHAVDPGLTVMELASIHARGSLSWLARLAPLYNEYMFSPRRRPLPKWVRELHSSVSSAGGSKGE